MSGGAETACGGCGFVTPFPQHLVGRGLTQSTCPACGETQSYGRITKQPWKTCQLCGYQFAEGVIWHQCQDPA